MGRPGRASSASSWLSDTALKVVDTVNLSMV